jgi:4-azaleucine resistance transporter AzlC
MAGSAEVRRGLRAGVPIALGYLPVAVTYGLLARQAGLSPLEVTGMSLLVYAGASQFMAVKMLAASLPVAQIVLAAFILNFRHFLMSASLSQSLKPVPRRPALLAYWVTDESFVTGSLSLGQEGFTSTSFLAMAALAYVAWAAGSLAGALFGALIPAGLASAMGVGLYAMFIALLVPSLKTNWRGAAVAGLAAAVSLALWLAFPRFAEGWRIILATLGASACGLALPRRREEARQ